MGCDIVTGGGPGLMQAANDGAKEAGAPGSVGIRVELPFEQDVNSFVEQAFEHETFFTWRGFVDWGRTAMLDPRLALASAKDFEIPVCLDTADEAIAVVRDLHRKWAARK